MTVTNVGANDFSYVCNNKNLRINVDDTKDSNSPVTVDYSDDQYSEFSIRIDNSYPNYITFITGDSFRQVNVSNVSVDDLKKLSVVNSIIKSSDVREATLSTENINDDNLLFHSIGAIESNNITFIPKTEFSMNSGVASIKIVTQPNGSQMLQLETSEDLINWISDAGEKYMSTGEDYMIQDVIDKKAKFYRTVGYKVPLKTADLNYDGLVVGDTTNVNVIGNHVQANVSEPLSIDFYKPDDLAQDGYQYLMLMIEGMSDGASLSVENGDLVSIQGEAFSYDEEDDYVHADGKRITYVYFMMPESEKLSIVLHGMDGGADYNVRSYYAKSWEDVEAPRFATESTFFDAWHEDISWNDREQFHDLINGNNNLSFVNVSYPDSHFGFKVNVPKVEGYQKMRVYFNDFDWQNVNDNAFVKATVDRISIVAEEKTAIGIVNNSIESEIFGEVVTENYVGTPSADKFFIDFVLPDEYVGKDIELTFAPVVSGNGDVKVIFVR